MCTLRTLFSAAFVLEAAQSFRVKPKKAKGAQASSAGRTEVVELFTFGAPGSGEDSAWNEQRTGDGGSDCFPGIRMYKEGWHSNIKHCDFAAALPTGQWHAKQNLMVLRPDGSPTPDFWDGSNGYDTGSIYEACNGSSGGEPGWPFPWGATPSVNIHHSYHHNLRQNTLEHWEFSWRWHEINGNRNRNQFIRGFVPAAISGEVMPSTETRGMTTAQVQEIRSKIESEVNGASWQPVHSGRFNVKLVGAMEINSSWLGVHDQDQVLLVQQHGSGAPGGLQDKDCILSFDPTDPSKISELWSNIAFGNKAFCGDYRHGGYVDELRRIITDSRWRPIQERMSRCRSVTVGGFSLGGALAEAFTFCAQRRQSSGNTQDFQNLMWESGSSGERLPEITQGDGNGQGIVR